MAHLRAYEVRQLLHNKFVVVMGDSVQRAVYKDLVLLLQKDCLLSSQQLKAKGELSFEHDVLLEGGRWGRMHNGSHYREVRQFRAGHHLVRFYFLTRVYSPYVENVLEELRWGPHAPDVVIMNSCLWDLSRYGQDFPRSYREDVESLFRHFYHVLPQACLLVWNTAMPVAQVVSGGFLPEAGQPGPVRLREDVMEANFYSAIEADRHGFDVLDLHFHFRHAGQHRLGDGVHWDEHAHRRLSQLLLAHLADAWGVDLPYRNPESMWIRNGPRGRRPGLAGRRQILENPGDQGRPGLSTPPCHPAPPQLPGTHPRARSPVRSYRRRTRWPYNQSFLHRRIYNNSLRQTRYTREAHPRGSLQSRLGPMRPGSTHNPGRRSSPYPRRRYSESRRRQQRRSERWNPAHAETRPHDQNQN
uniref:PC-esterase domain containing 1B n=1 Tax=Oryctolagus cuniculus TaxID=9986 RepID=A0A5F9D1I5_RABIT|nr:PC-esterase domain-containing protein 1B [Oryctolagus cuniculus]